MPHAGAADRLAVQGGVGIVLMVGREGERARIEQALNEVSGGPVGLCLEGAPGIGKTTVWREAVDAARERGYRVLCTTPAEPDAQLSFAALGDLLDGEVSEALADLPDPQRRALRASLLLDHPSDAPSGPGLVPRAVLSVIRELAAEGPLVVAIDDEQWLDRASARVLGFALCRLREEPVSVLLARRTNDDGSLWPELARGFAGVGLERATIAPLDDQTVELLLRERLGRPIPRRTLRRIHAICGGNPFYALSIARELPEEQGAIDGEVSIPRTLADVMRRRLAHVEPRAHDALLAVAASSSPTLALLDAVVPGFALSDLASAVRGEVIELAGERVRFTHPLLASAHYASAPDARRRELHRTLAGVLDDAEERARHLALGAEAPDEQVALALDQAADRATSRGAPEASAELLEQAVRLTPLDRVQARHLRLINAARMHTNGGEKDRARHLLDQLLPKLPPGPTRARALYELACTGTNDYETLLEILDEALAEAEDHDRIRVPVESWYCEGLIGRGKFKQAADRRRAAVESAKRVGDPGLLADAVARKAASAFWAGQPIDIDELEAAIELEELSDNDCGALPSFVLGQILSRTDDVIGTRLALEGALERATRRGEEGDVAYVLIHLVVLEFLAAGDHEEAKRKFASCEPERGRDTKTDIFILWADSFLAAGRGELAEARANAERSLDLCVEHASVGAVIPCIDRALAT